MTVTPQLRIANKKVAKVAKPLERTSAAPQLVATHARFLARAAYDSVTSSVNVLHMTSCSTDAGKQIWHSITEFDLHHARRACGVGGADEAA